MTDIHVDTGKGQTIKGTIKSKLVCAVCNGVDLDIYIVEDTLMLKTAYQCRNCKTVRFFGAGSQ